ncbi:energy-coupling factor ABC transporter ATP-binding protein [Paenibacillus sp. YYML68]|uniref:energy-coupling factor ABC transporter ATP-binding protein n=1 Tax=Paenibacillus sp. YYML68 TaxID=2909250 RepID=UPI002492ABB0|nr:ABC transporter ATP-binding protein [Paenibacillus sp. YYML68]
MNHPIVEALHVQYEYPGAAAGALNGLSVQVPAGARTALVGHNGSGKSTFFLQMIGLCRPDAGQLLWNGQPYSYNGAHLKQLRRQIGLVFQDPEHQLILNTARQDIGYGLRNAGYSDREAKLMTDEVLEKLKLMELADTPLHHLSLGQKKRVALAGVLVLKPQLLLLDEPTAYLDRASERQLLDELDRIHAEGVSVLMASHDMDVAYAWADWVLVMDHGRCVMAGTPQDVFSQSNAIRQLGLDQPMLLQMWEALPASIRGSHPPPKQMEELLALCRLLDSDGLKLSTWSYS